MKKKTEKEWFKTLNELEQKQFKDNCGSDFEDMIGENVISFGGFISQAFQWHMSKEGFDYWLEISERNQL